MTAERKIGLTACDCPHCGVAMKKWAAAGHNFCGDGMGFVSDFMFVCFNDDCPMYVKGWNSLFERYGRVGSVRAFYNPDDGEEGVLPVAHKMALRGDILED
ncbi:hypothetical protein SIID45300_03188 [Candidatus Magnetaquicoccaceae bacterium FCR-1]|uniref:Uncharacterized protein n=1 Tax=Candidatus Magnetaquiglobus chichijimensis TaxID=3141448 RepID=A0ABQ0CD57_9PROT